MTEQVKPAANYAPVYAAAVYPSIVPIFRRHGYALAVHGSLARDFDLIAVPWTEAASEPFDVVEQLIAAFAIRLIEGSDGIASSKPHGRVAYTLSIGHGECAIDLSFMPRRTDESPLETGRTDHSEQPLNMVPASLVAEREQEIAALRAGNERLNVGTQRLRERVAELEDAIYTRCRWYAPMMPIAEEIERRRR